MVILRVMLLFIIFVTLFYYVSMREYQSDPDSEAVVLRAVRGRTARIPCGNGRVFLDGTHSFILWLKDDRDLVYRYPNEEDASNHILGLPCDGDFCEDPTSLLLKRVTDQDSGRYRCRIHYQVSPSVDYVYELKLVDSLSTPRIYGNGQQIFNGLMSPIGLGSDLNLVCEVDDERTDTEVYWQRNGVLIVRARIYYHGVIRANVNVPNVTRDELNAHYECLAQNADVSEPVFSGVVIKMYLAPLSVQIRTRSNNFEIGVPRVVDCVVVGCVPPPNVTWHLGDTLLKPRVHKEQHEGNYTVSSLILTPSINNDQNDLVCRVYNSQLQSIVFEDHIKLTVGYIPMCVIGHQVKVGAIPGEMATATCIIESSPEPTNMSWRFDYNTLYTSNSAINVKKLPGYAHRYEVSLTWEASEKDLGKLFCTATNAFGEQLKPCSLSIIRGGPPLPPHCNVNQTPNAWIVQCIKSWDGGRPQTIYLDVFDHKGALKANVSDAAGNFNLPKLEGEHNITIVTYSRSSWGVSTKTVIRLQNSSPKTTPVISNTITAHTPFINWMYLGGWVGICFGVIGLVSYISSKTSCRRRAAPPRPDAESNPDLVPRPDGSFHREPDVTRDDRANSGTTISTADFQYTPSPVSSYRLLMGCGPHGSQETCPTGQHSYYV